MVFIIKMKLIKKKTKAVTVFSYISACDNMLSNFLIYSRFCGHFIVCKNGKDSLNSVHNINISSSELKALKVYLEPKIIV